MHVSACVRARTHTRKHTHKQLTASCPSFAPASEIYDDLNLVPGLIGRVRHFAGNKVTSEHFGIPVPFLEPKHLEIEWDEVGGIGEGGERSSGRRWDPAFLS